jgi:hypothetical protein
MRGKERAVSFLDERSLGVLKLAEAFRTRLALPPVCDCRIRDRHHQSTSLRRRLP